MRMKIIIDADGEAYFRSLTERIRDYYNRTFQIRLKKSRCLISRVLPPSVFLDSCMIHFQLIRGFFGRACGIHKEDLDIIRWLLRQQKYLYGAKAHHGGCNVSSEATCHCIWEQFGL